MIRSTRSSARVSSAALPWIDDPQLRAALRAALPASRGITQSMGVPGILSSRRVRTMLVQQPSEQISRRPAPVPPVWNTFSGGGGAFRGILVIPKTRRALGSGEGQMRFEVQLASDSAFTTNLTSYTFGAGSFDIYMPSVTRFARGRTRFFDSAFSAWAVFGSPSSAVSGAAGAGVPEPAPPPSPSDTSPSDLIVKFAVY